MKPVAILACLFVVSLIAVSVLAKDPPKPRTEADAVTPVGGTDKRQDCPADVFGQGRPR